MKLFALIAVATYCIVSLVMGIRLLLMARRTRELPEFIIGITFLLGGMLGYPFNVASGFLLLASKPDAATLAYMTGQIGLASAAFFMLLAWRSIFLPERRSGHALVIGWGILLGVSLVYALMTTGPIPADRLVKASYWWLLVMQAGCYAIMGIASLRYASMLRRRCELGMADPVVANRLWLWGVSNSAVTFSYVYSMTAGVMLRYDLPNIYHPSVIASVGLTSACCITLGFLPPRGYVERIRANAAHGGA